MKKRNLAVVALGCLALAGCGGQHLSQADGNTDPEDCVQQANALMEVTQDSIDVEYTLSVSPINWLISGFSSNRVCDTTEVYPGDLEDFNLQMSEYLYKMESVQSNENGTCNYREDDTVKSAPCELRTLKDSPAEGLIRKELSPKATPKTVDKIIRYGEYYQIGDLKIVGA